MTDDNQRVRFDGQSAVVTGSGSGLGRAHALELARRGAAVVVNDVNADGADAVVAEIQDAGGQAVASYESVVTSQGGVKIIDTAVNTFGAIDIVVNNAGFLRNGWFADLSPEDIDDVIDVHLRGAFNVTQPAWRHMQERRYGRVIITCSSSGLFARPAQASYAAAKAGLYGLMRALAHEGSEVGINVNCLLPYAGTGIKGGQPIPDDDKYCAQYNLDPVVAGGYRMEPELTTHMVIALAARESEINGEAFSVCLGRYGRVFVGVTRGWVTPDEHATSAEDIIDNMPPIRDLGDFTVPANNFDERRTAEDQVAEVLRSVQQR